MYIIISYNIYYTYNIPTYCYEFMIGKVYVTIYIIYQSQSKFHEFIDQKLLPNSFQIGPFVTYLTNLILFFRL